MRTKSADDRTYMKGQLPHPVTTGVQDLLNRTWHNLIKSQVTRKGVRAVKTLWNRTIDTILNIDTMTGPPPNEAINIPGFTSDNQGIGQIDYINLARLVRIVAPSTGEVIFDLGCGRGRSLLCFALSGAKKVVGIEILELLANKARENAARLRWRRSEIEIHHCDALNANLSEGTIFLLFNPFGEETLRKVLNKIRSSIIAVPRMVTVVYYKPVSEHVLMEAGWLRRTDNYAMFGDYTVSIWQSSSREINEVASESVISS